MSDELKFVLTEIVVCAESNEKKFKRTLGKVPKNKIRNFG